jgi:hypothetical protein
LWTFGALSVDFHCPALVVDAAISVLACSALPAAIAVGEIADSPRPRFSSSA